MTFAVIDFRIGYHFLEHYLMRIKYTSQERHNSFGV